MEEIKKQVRIVSWLNFIFGFIWGAITVALILGHFNIQFKIV